MRLHILILSILSLLVAMGCEHADPLAAGNQLEPTLSSIQANIFDLNCALSGCHAGTNPTANQNLSDGRAWANIVNVPSGENPALFRVDPGNPDNSYLVWKIEGRPEISGQPMPLGRPALSVEQITTIRQWITDGALDN